MAKKLSVSEQHTQGMAITAAPTPRLRTAATRLVSLVATPLVPADYLDLFDPLQSPARLRAQVLEIRPETPTR